MAKNANVMLGAISAVALVVGLVFLQAATDGIPGSDDVMLLVAIALFVISGMALVAALAVAAICGQLRELLTDSAPETAAE